MMGLSLATPRRIASAHFSAEILPRTQDAKIVIELTPGSTIPWHGLAEKPSGEHYPLCRESFTELLAYPPESVDVILARNVLPTQLGLDSWQEVVQILRRVLKPGGHLIFDYYNRTYVRGAGDIQHQLEYFTMRLLSRYMARQGFRLDMPESERGRESVGVVDIACFTRL